MSRVANTPVELPGGVEVALSPGASDLSVSGAKGKTPAQADRGRRGGGQRQDGVLRTSGTEPSGAGDGRHRACAREQTWCWGVSQGFERRLQLVGVGYRAQAQGRTLNLQLGFSHPVRYAVPEGVDVQTPSVTEVVVSGADKQLVGQVAADIRAFSAAGAVQRQRRQIPERESAP